MSPRRTARLAGLLYLVVALLGGWAQLVRTQVHVPDDAAATAAAIADHATAVRLAVGADVVDATAFALFGLAMQQLLHHVHARAAAALVLGTWLSAAMALVMLTFHVGALLVVTDPAVSSAVGDPDGLALLLLDMQSAAYSLAGVFFALWMAAAAYLVARSGMFARFVAPLVAAGSVAWLLNTVLVLVVPDLPAVDGLTAAVATVGEISLLTYLLVRGVRRGADATPRVPSAATA
ncbi:hypothetical protein Cch01nite_41250 [Cellulomonas chitinilytica]|uniref:DUF4386 domain-containing protein n=1 Tax=Cellulomonas chitinilytica TaxID=398759 RepID=A0A919P894_9CELL|nr:DUF4386 domain-containing protein [Cellulomonas chitinilytica]GIG23401.1 hypothetical protein Cch01nite_41250 [Cellulomonas chitinilytica]